MADRRTEAAATTSASVRRFDGHALKGNRQEECVRMQEKMARSAPRTLVRPWNAESRPHLESGLLASSENVYHSRQFGCHLGNTG